MLEVPLSTGPAPPTTTTTWPTAAAAATSGGAAGISHKMPPTGLDLHSSPAPKTASRGPKTAPWVARDVPDRPRRPPEATDEDDDDDENEDEDEDDADPDADADDE
eukprot:4328565-Pyramimonas_sp.AAC.1